MSYTARSIIELLICILKIYLFFKIFAYFGILQGIVIIYLLVISKHAFMWHVLGLEHLNGMDKAFLTPCREDQFTIVSAGIFINFDPEKVRTLMIERAIKPIRKLRSRLVYKYFDYYWEEVPLERAVNECLLIKPKLKDEAELKEYLEKEMNINHEVEKSMPYQVHFIPMDGGKGAIVSKYDHIFSDGLGTISVTCTIADNYSVDIFPKIMRMFNDISQFQRFLIYMKDLLTFPYYLVVLLYRDLTVSSGMTPFKRKTRARGHNIFDYSTNYEMSSLEKVKKTLNISFNDLTVAIISLAIKRFMNSKGYPASKNQNLVLFIPIGKTKIPRNAKEVTLKNSMAGIFTDVPLIENLANECQRVSESLKAQIKNSGIVEGTKYTVNVFSEILPFFLYNEFIELICTSKVDAIVSNVPGPTRTLTYDGAEMVDLIPLTNTGKMTAFIPCISYNKKFKFLFAVDQNLGIDPKEVLKNIDDIITEIQSTY